MKHLFFSVLISAILFSSCKHSQDCPALSQDQLQWIPYHNNDTIRFTNASNEKIKFVAQNREASPSYSEDCGRGEPAGRYCKQCVATASINSVSEAHRGNYYRLNMLFESDSQDGNTANSGHLEYVLFDQLAGFSVSGQAMTIAGNYGGQLVSTVTLGGIAYHDVYVAERDTVAFPATIIWKSYYNKQYGVLGFEDRQAHATFYRE